nr:hypothetical protein [Polaromonas sp.]
MGILAAAREKSLGLVSLIQERFHLVCLKSELPTAQVQAPLRKLQGDEWQTMPDQLPGSSGERAPKGQSAALARALATVALPQRKKEKK